MGARFFSGVGVDVKFDSNGDWDGRKVEVLVLVGVTRSIFACGCAFD